MLSGKREHARVLRIKHAPYFGYDLRMAVNIVLLV